MIHLVINPFTHQASNQTKQPSIQPNRQTTPQLCTKKGKQFRNQLQKANKPSSKSTKPKKSQRWTVQGIGTIQEQSHKSIIQVNNQTAMKHTTQKQTN